MQNQQTVEYDVVVIGGGPAGLAAALEAHKTSPDLNILVLERDTHLGGILQQCIHNGFGLHFFGEELTGPEYAARFVDQLDGTGIDVWTDTMVIELNKRREVLAISPKHGLVRIQARAIVLAMGCRERTRGALSIPGTRPAGVYTAGFAQRMVNLEGYMPGKKIVILGSGDIGLIMARRLEWEGAQVEMVCELMPFSSGLNRNIVQCLEDNDIPLKFNHTVTRVHGKGRLEAVTVAEVDPATKKPITGTEQIVECDTLLLSVGLIPENELTGQAGIQMDPVTSGAVVDETRQTSLPGVFACGNVLHVHDLVDNVSDEAILAGRAAAHYVFKGLEAQSQDYWTVAAGQGVRYVVPQRISKAAASKIDLYYRVDQAYHPARVTVDCADAQLCNRKKLVMTPGEMEKITVNADAIASNLVVHVEGEA